MKMDQQDDNNNNSNSADTSNNKRKAAAAVAEDDGGCPMTNGDKSAPSLKAEKAEDAETVTTATSATAAAAAFVPICQEGDRPQKKFYRQRAHCNPLSHNDSFEYPLRPDLMDWTTEAFYPGLKKQKEVEGDTSATSTSRNNNNDGVIVAHAQPTVLDVGCGFGGLTLALARILPNEIILGMEIRAKVTEYVRLRIVAARKDPATALLLDNDDNDNNYEQQQQQQQPPPPTTTTTTSSPPATIITTDATDTTTTTTTTSAAVDTATTCGSGPSYQNAAVLRTNSMKFLPHYFAKHSIRKLFFCFPDPHFKRKNHTRRIISDRLLTEYAYLLKPNIGKLYCITDVRELHEWHVQKCQSHDCFECIVIVHPQDETASSSKEVIEQALHDDPCINAMMNETEEGKKVHRNGGDKFFAVYRRIATPCPSTKTTTTDTTVMPTTSTTITCLDASNFFA